MSAETVFSIADTTALVRLQVDRVGPAKAGPYEEASARFTRSGVKGTSRIRTPVASKIALPIAAATMVIAVSPAPIAGTLVRSISTHSTFGI
jgi:hypothetical protein